MIKIEYTDEVTFITEEVEFSDEHYELAQDIHKHYIDEIFSKCSPLMVAKDKKTLLFAVNLGDRDKDRDAYERGGNLYIVRIEKPI